MLKETAISVVVNVAISAGFMFLVFGRSRLIELWGLHGLALDFLPQTFMISAMSVLVPMVLTRSRIASGRIAGHAPRLHHPLVRNLAFRMLFMGAILSTLSGGMAVVVLNLLWAGPAAFWHVFPWKLAYGALVGTIATPLGLALALADPRRVALNGQERP